MRDAHERGGWRGVWPAVGLACGLAVTGLASWGAWAVAAEPGQGETTDVRPTKPEPEFSKEDLAFYAEKVKPILEQNCGRCHGSEKFRAGLSYMSRLNLIEGGESGPAIDLADPESSLLLSAINYDSFQMPPDGKMSADKIAVVTDWVKRGAPMPAAPKLVHHEEGPPKINEQTKSHWAFRKVQRPEPPAVENEDWVRNPIDRFVLSKLESKGMAPAGPAEKAALVRRVYFDLIGLPPTMAQVDSFVNDPSPNALEKVVDELLDSPHYGEKWGRFWLDLVRYAETNSFERDNPKPNAWRYRDYVVDSFNKDKPYGQFLTEQLAGDELENVTKESIIATGYYRLGAWDDEPADRAQAFYDEMDDLITTTTQVMLGLTVNCARCHDHKLDPIPQKDYYQILAFFQDLQPYAERGDQMASSTSQTPISDPEVVAKHVAREQSIKNIQEEMRQIEQRAIVRMPGVDQRKTEGGERGKVLREKLKHYAEPRDWSRYQIIKDQLQAYKDEKLPPLEMALSVNKCLMTPRDTFVLIRGNPGAHGPQVQPGFLSVVDDTLPSLPKPQPGAKTVGQRKILADWIASPENPLTARVWVNRVWQQHFGRGIVPSASNVGLKGDLPTHPELLDWLTSKFTAGGMKLKPLHRLMMLSNTYRMAASAAPEVVEKDPENMLFSRFGMRRLTAEEMRDTMLAVSNQLNLSVGGPSIFIEMPKEVLAGQSVPGQGWGTSSESEQNRRSIYIHLKRSLLPPVLSGFDFPDPDGSCPVRFSTTQPTQALISLNGKAQNELAEKFAKRIRNEGLEDTEKQVRFALEVALCRHPTDEEVARGVKLIEDLKTSEQCDDEKALNYYCLVVLNLNEFVYLD